MKTLFYISRLLLGLLLVTGAGSCSFSLLPARTATPAAAAPSAEPAPSAKEARRAVEFLRKYPDFVRQHRELFPVDTVQVRVPYALPAVEAQVKYVPVHDTVYLAQESTYLDSLVRTLERNLDVAQRAAAATKLKQLLYNRPVLRDTLRADTLGVHIKIWLSGRHYKVLIRRDAITGEAAGQVVTGGLPPCPPLPAPANYRFYDPRAWPLWLVFALGVLVGVGLLYGLVRLVYHAQSKGAASA